MNAIRSLLLAAVLLYLAGCATTPTAPSTAANPAETAALAVLASDAGVHEKARACQELAVVGGPAAVPALAALLSHEQLADYARSGLESIKDPAAGAALRQALNQLSGRQLAGVVNSLGVRREIAAVPELQRLASGANRDTATEALASLGMVGTAEAAQTLQKVLTAGPADLRIPAAHAALVAAAQLAKDGKTAAARGLLDSIIRTQPTGHLASVAKNQAAALSATRGSVPPM
jgi:hypothetical protein